MNAGMLMMTTMTDAIHNKNFPLTGMAIAGKTRVVIQYRAVRGVGVQSSAIEDNSSS
jgi:hypothetical protein